MPWKLALATADTTDDLLEAGWEPFQVNYMPESAIAAMATETNLVGPSKSSEKLAPVIALRLWVTPQGENGPGCQLPVLRNGEKEFPLRS